LDYLTTIFGVTASAWNTEDNHGISVRTDGLRAQIRTRDLSNTKDDSQTYIHDVWCLCNASATSAEVI